MEVLQLIIAGVVGIVGYVSGSKLITVLTERLFKKSDAAALLHDTNQAKMIDADQLAMQIIHEDMKALKVEIKDVRDLLDTVKEERSDLKAENMILKNTEKLLTERVDRQGKKIEALSKDLDTTKGLLNEAKSALLKRDVETLALRNELNATTLQVHSLMQQVKNTDHTEADKP